MKAAASRARFLESPEGHYLRGRSWIFACPCTGVFATLLGGRPDEDDLAALVGSYRLRAAKLPHVVLFDGSRVRAVDERAFDTMLDLMVARARPLTRALRRAAFVHGGGVPGAVLAGLARVLPLTCERRLFLDTASALDWLDVPPVGRSQVLALADSLAADVHVVRLGAMFEEDPTLTLERAARALAVTPRTLQRRLLAAGTTFRREADRVRLEGAMRRMTESDAPLTSIALEIGFSSLQAFTDWFRAETRETPSAWRARRARSTSMKAPPRAR